MSLEDLIAEAARLAADKRQTSRVRSDMRQTRLAPAMADAMEVQLAAEARSLAADIRRRAEADARAHARQAAYERRIAEQDRMFAQRAESELEMDACVLRHEQVRGLPGYTVSARRQCYLCARELPKGARRWCSIDCSNTWWRNHLWSMASTAARERDKNACVTCGRTNRERVDHCGADGQVWPCASSRLAGLDHPLAGHWRITRYVALEVNHKDPLVGKGYANSCRHHLDGLETLCHECHVKVTNSQRQQRSDERLARTLSRLGLS